MTVSEVLQEANRRGIILQAHGSRLRVNAPKGALTPELRDALAAHKAELMPLLTTSQAPASRQATALPPPDVTIGEPCPRCGASDWRDTPDAGRWCVPCVVSGRDRVAAVKVRSDALDAEIWVVADDLPREAWPTDAPVYTHAEVRILRQIGPDVLAWVHAVKVEFGGSVIRGAPLA